MDQEEGAGRGGEADFAMVHLKTSVHFGGRAIPACLPRASWGGDYLAGQLMTVSGWGRLKYMGPRSKVLQSVRVPGITNDMCGKAYHPTPITESMLCAGDLDKGEIDACQSDSGGKYFEVTVYREL